MSIHINGENGVVCRVTGSAQDSFRLLQKGVLIS